jgi:hypothetical protein
VRRLELIMGVLSSWIASALVLSVAFRVNDRFTAAQSGPRTLVLCVGMYCVLMLTSPIYGCLSRSNLKFAKIVYVLFVISIVWPGTLAVLAILRRAAL